MLLQDQHKKFGKWLASRLDAREVVRKVAKEIEMIRMNPAHDTVNPPGCYSSQQANVIQQEKTLNKEIDIYNKGFKRGYDIGYDDGYNAATPSYKERSSEFDR